MFPKYYAVFDSAIVRPHVVQDNVWLPVRISKECHQAPPRSSVDSFCRSFVVVTPLLWKFVIQISSKISYRTVSGDGVPDEEGAGVSRFETLRRVRARARY